jgi:hypothetical protein
VLFVVDRYVSEGHEAEWKSVYDAMVKITESFNMNGHNTGGGYATTARFGAMNMGYDGKAPTRVITMSYRNRQQMAAALASSFKTPAVYDGGEPDLAATINLLDPSPTNRRSTAQFMDCGRRGMPLSQVPSPHCIIVILSARDLVGDDFRTSSFEQMRLNQAITAQRQNKGTGPPVAMSIIGVAIGENEKTGGNMGRLLNKVRIFIFTHYDD